MDWQRVIDTAGTQLTTVGLKVAGAIALFLVGRWLIRLAVRVMSAALDRQRIDPTLQRYIGNIVGVALNIVLVVAILGYFGVETTSFAALIAAMGIAAPRGAVFSPTSRPALFRSCCGPSRSVTT
jgi:small conductance mechanosensitive channel